MKNTSPGKVNEQPTLSSYNLNEDLRLVECGGGSSRWVYQLSADCEE